VSVADRDQLRELASLHALGVLSAEERAELAAAMAADPELAADVRALEDTTGALGAVVPQIDPPARLRGRVLAVAGLEADERPAPGIVVAGPRGVGPGRAGEAAAPVPARRTSSALPAWLTAAAAVILASGLGLWALQLRTALDGMNARVERAEAEVVRIQRTLDASQQQTRTLEARNEVLFAPDMQRVDLAGQPVAPASSARAFVSRHSGLAFAANQLPALPADKVYQLWVIPQGQAPVSAGLLAPDASGHASLFFMMPAEMPPPAVIAVTVEPAGGVPQPTGEMVLKG
jgi:anti-sigma-K factor RskA